MNIDSIHVASHGRSDLGYLDLIYRLSSRRWLEVEDVVVAVRLHCGEWKMKN